jgi:3-deoxy-7-phosphoheptulonate synthase
MRVYFEMPTHAPRLEEGLIYDPDLDGRGDIRRDVRCATIAARMRAHRRTAASEILDLVTPQYYAELLAWGAIGARTTESPLHRQMASALSAPVGFKNPTSGNFQPALDAIVAAAQPHKFPSISLDGRRDRRYDDRQSALSSRVARRTRWNQLR